MTEALFSYGTLQLREVQLANYGHELVGEPDSLVGYRVEGGVINGPNVARISGRALNIIARRTGDPGDRIEGVVFELTEAELATTDAYEVEPYRRAQVTLESGRTAWAYVGPPAAA